MQKIVNSVLLVLILFNCIFVGVGALLYPLASIDAVSIWLLKAKAIYLAHGNLPLDILKSKTYLNTHPQYPILAPFIFYIVYVILGGINEQVIALINPTLYALTLLIAYNVFRKIQFNQTLSLLFTYVYSMFSSLLAQGGRKHSGDADIFIVFINWATIFLALNFIKTKSVKMLSLIIILIMISSQIKAEGIFLVSLLFFLPITKKTRLVSIAVSLIPFVIWRLVIAHFGIPNDFYYLLPPVQEVITRSFNIFYYTILEMAKINNWYIFWPVFAVFIVFAKLKTEFIKKTITKTLLLYAALFFCSYLFSSIAIQTYVPSSIDRVLLQLSPFYFLIFADLVRNKSLKKLFNFS